MAVSAASKKRFCVSRSLPSRSMNRSLMVLNRAASGKPSRGRCDHRFLDNGRVDEGTAAEGYTLQEACVMARSSIAGQRAAAMHLLASVLAQVAPHGSMDLNIAGRPRSNCHQLSGTVS